jgi:hypothetical protein
MSMNDDVVDQCWFCKGWFFTRKLKKVVVRLEAFSSDVVEKMACTTCSSSLDHEGAPTRK